MVTKISNQLSPSRLRDLSVRNVPNQRGKAPLSCDGGQVGLEEASWHGFHNKLNKAGSSVVTPIEGEK